MAANTTNVQLDQKDIAILNLLYVNSRLSCREIARKTGIPAMTVLNRIKRFEEAGVILEYTTRADIRKLGYNILAYVIVIIDYAVIAKNKIGQGEVANEIIKHPNVSVADLVTGPDRDVLVKIKCRDTEELNRVLDDIRKIPGVSRTDTMNILYEARKACLYENKCSITKKLIIEPIQMSKTLYLPASLL